MVAPRRFALLGHTHNLDDLVGDTDDIDEGSTNLFFTNERAEDAIGAILADTTSIDFTYTDNGAGTGSISAVVLPEFIQDTVGDMLIDSASINFQYTDSGVGMGSFTAAVLPAGVDHGGLAGLSDDDHPQYPLAAGTETISGAWTFSTSALFSSTGTGFTIERTNFPNFRFFASANPSDEKYFDHLLIGTDYQFRLLNDALSATTTALAVARSGMTALAVRLPNDNEELTLGAGNDLRLYHDGTNNYIRSDTGSLFFHDANELFAVMFNSGGNSGSIGFYTDATFRGQLSAVGATNAIITGAAVGDIAYRAQAGSIIFSVDAGSTIAFSVNNTRIDANTPIQLKGYTVTGLPAGAQGDTAFVTDALAPTFLTAIAGGGAIVTPVFYNGTNWVAY